MDGFLTNSFKAGSSFPALKNQRISRAFYESLTCQSKSEFF